MSCHRIGLGMNSVVEKSIEMFENEEIDIIVQAIKNHSMLVRKLLLPVEMVFIGVMGMKMKLLPVLLIVIVVIV